MGRILGRGPTAERPRPARTVRAWPMAMWGAAHDCAAPWPMTVRATAVAAAHDVRCARSGGAPLGWRGGDTALTGVASDGLEEQFGWTARFGSVGGDAAAR
jgi:hypothetical protein